MSMGTKVSHGGKNGIIVGMASGNRRAIQFDDKTYGWFDANEITILK